MSRPRSEQALLDYFDRLLQPPAVIAERAPERLPERPPAEPAPVAPAPVMPPINRVRLQQLLDQVSEPIATTAAVVAPVSVPVSPTVVTPAVTSVVTPAVKPVASPVVSLPKPATVATAAAEPVVEALAGYSNARYRSELPARFQALIFRIDELRIALPLYLLGGILKQTKEPTPIVGRPSWLLGLLPNEPTNINVVDTGRYLLGDKYRPELVEGYKYVIRIGDSDWGLACTELCATQDIGDDDIRWYDSNPTRPWLAGMIKAERCALLNSRALVEALAQSGKAA